MDVIDIGRFADGKIVEHWGVPDRFHLMVQLGMVPMPVPVSAPQGPSVNSPAQNSKEASRARCKSRLRALRIRREHIASFGRFWSPAIRK